MGYSNYPLVGAVEVFPRDSGTIWGYVGKKYGVIIFAKHSNKKLKTNLNRYIRGTPKSFLLPAWATMGIFAMVI